MWELDLLEEGYDEVLSEEALLHHARGGWSSFRPASPRGFGPRGEESAPNTRRLSA
jgi:hypothetical protein